MFHIVVFQLLILSQSRTVWNFAKPLASIKYNATVLQWLCPANTEIYYDIQYGGVLIENLLEFVGGKSKHHIDLAMGLSFRL